MDGIDNFMDTVMGIDNQDFLLKMEGYAIQGIKGLFHCPHLVEKHNLYLRFGKKSPAMCFTSSWCYPRRYQQET